MVWPFRDSDLDISLHTKCKLVIQYFFIIRRYILSPEPLTYQFWQVVGFCFLFRYLEALKGCWLTQNCLLTCKLSVDCQHNPTQGNCIMDTRHLFSFRWWCPFFPCCCIEIRMSTSGVEMWSFAHKCFLQR